MQSLPLEIKILKTQLRIREWYEYWNSEVFVSFSGGKDSTVLLDIARKLYPDIEAVFSNTGLEYPEIREFVKSIPNVRWITPEKDFRTVILEKGYPVIGKDISQSIYYARQGRQWAINKLNGLHPKSGEPCSYSQRIYARYKYLVNAPFKISSLCCRELKKKPFHIYEKESKKKAMIGNMASESLTRKVNYLKTGCNLFSSSRPVSNPLGFWTDKDIWEYLRKYHVRYSKIYDMGYDRTGCMFCMFGSHLEKEPNRFQLMEYTHPNYWKYCLKPVQEGGLGMKEVLNYLKISYKSKQLFFV